MRLNQVCYLVNVRKRKILRLLPDNQLGQKLGEKVISAMYHHKDPHLTTDELELLAELLSTPFTDKLFKEEIEKERRSAKKT